MDKVDAVQNFLWALFEESPKWMSDGCTLDTVVECFESVHGMELHRDFSLEDIITTPHLSYDATTSTLRPKIKKRKVEKKKKIVSGKVKEFEAAMISDYYRNHHVDIDFSVKANGLIKKLGHYLEVTFRGMSLITSVHAVGSFAAGLASKSESKVDVAVRIDFGATTNEPMPSLVADMLFTAMENCPYFATISKHGDLIECVFDYSLVLSLHAFSAGNFPINWLHHARLLSTVARGSPVFILLVTYVKSWARSHQIFDENCFGLGGFGWTITVVAFLISQRQAENPFDNKLVYTEQYGPLIAQSYSFAPSRDSASDLSIPFYQTARAFFIWLASSDLTLHSICMDGLRSPMFPGWVTVIDPINGFNTIPLPTKHSDVISYALAVTEAAREAVKVFK
jgi:hypothetical protein